MWLRGKYLTFWRCKSFSNIGLEELLTTLDRSKWKNLNLVTWNYSCSTYRKTGLCSMCFQFGTTVKENGNELLRTREYLIRKPIVSTVKYVAKVIIRGFPYPKYFKCQCRIGKPFSLTGWNILVLWKHKIRFLCIVCCPHLTLSIAKFSLYTFLENSKHEL